MNQVRGSKFDSNIFFAVIKKKRLTKDLVQVNTNDLLHNLEVYGSGKIVYRSDYYANDVFEFA